MKIESGRADADSEYVLGVGHRFGRLMTFALGAADLGP